MQIDLLSTVESHSIEVEQSAAAAPETFWVTIVLCMLGLSTLVIWQCWYGGFTSLRQAPVRRTRMFGFLPVILLSLWILLLMGINKGILFFFTDSSESFQEALSYPLMAILNIGLIIVMLVVAHRTFARRLKGFGLNIKTIGKDTVFSLIHLLAVYPLILFALWAVLTIGQFIKKDFNLEAHQSLTFLVENGNIGLKAITIIFAAVIVPVFEEMLFRGFLQTSISSLSGRPWTAILLTSLLFSVLHPATHVPALFVLSCGLGYAYERSGSLFRPILMHIFFNGFNIAGTLLFAS